MCLFPSFHDEDGCCPIFLYMPGIVGGYQQIYNSIPSDSCESILGFSVRSCHDTLLAFLAADEIIVPMTPELLPLKGMRMLDSFVSTLQRVKPNLRLGGVFIARFNHRKLNKVVEQAVKSRYETITMKTRIRENIALAESAGSGQSIFEYDPQSNGAKDYQALTEEIISRNQ